MNQITQFISFATLHSAIKMPVAYKRWCEQINYLKQIGIVKHGKVYTEDDLDETWYNRFKNYISDYALAYWSWKPYIINQLFQKMQYGDSLCYFDGGCILPIENEELKKKGHCHTRNT